MSREERQQNATAKKRGKNSIVLKRRQVVDETLGDMEVFVRVIGEDECIRTEAEAREVIEEKDLRGDFLCVAPRAWGPIKDGNLKRGELVTVGFDDAKPKPETPPQDLGL